NAPGGGLVGCSVSGFLSALGAATGTSLDVAIGNYGIIRALQVSDDPRLGFTLPPNYITMKSSDTAQLFAGIRVARVVSRVPPITDQTAIAFLTQCAEDAAILLLVPAPVRALAHDVVGFHELANSLELGSDGTSVPLGPSEGPLSIGFGKLA